MHSKSFYYRFKAAHLSINQSFIGVDNTVYSYVTIHVSSCKENMEQETDGLYVELYSVWSVRV
jgi:hypothetical protein